MPKVFFLTCFMCRAFSVNKLFLFRLVDEGVMEQEANQNLVANHTNLMSRAFQETDSYSPSSTPIYSQVGEDQSKSLKVRSL